MKIDLYSKAVLTVIALCLTVIVLRDFQPIPSAFASSSSSLDGTIDVRIVGINTSDEMNVSISDIDTYDQLPVDLREIGGSSVSSSSGKLIVKID